MTIKNNAVFNSVTSILTGKQSMLDGAKALLPEVLKFADPTLIAKLKKSKLTKDSNAVIDSAYSNFSDEFASEMRNAINEWLESKFGERVPVKLEAGTTWVQCDESKAENYMTTRMAWEMDSSEYRGLSSKGKDAPKDNASRKEWLSPWRLKWQTKHDTAKSDTKKVVKAVYAEMMTESGSSVEVLPFNARLNKALAGFIKLYRNGVKNGDKLTGKKAERVESLINELDKALNS